MADLKKARKKCEEKIYKAFKILDPTGTNTEYWKKKFSKMNDKEFYNFFADTDTFQLRFQTIIFKIDPKMSQVCDFLHFLNVPIEEKVTMPFLYRNKEGRGVSTLPVIVVYLPLKRLKQMSQLKGHASSDINKRDFRTGLLLDETSNGATSDREIESAAVMNLNYALKELVSYRADAMNAKSKFYAQINNTGMVSQKDVPVDFDDSLARNLISAYLLGSHLSNNLVALDGIYLPRTLKKSNAKSNGLKRE